MPIVARRLFATSRGSNSSTRHSKASKSAFADRFGPLDKQPPHPQASFPTWPSASPQQASSRPSNYALRRPPPNLLTPLINETEGEDRPGKEPSSHAFKEWRAGELFSDVIGNASALVKTASFEAKLAIQPAMEARKQQLLAAKNNIHRFESLPPPAQHAFDQEEAAPSGVTLQTSGNSSVTKPDNPSSSSSKANSHIMRPLSISPSGHRMLSTLSADVSSSCVPFTVVPPPVVTDDWAGPRHLPPTAPLVNCSLWQETLAWMLDYTTSHRFRSPSLTSRIFRHLHSIPQHFMYSNRVLSLLPPTIYASPLLARGYATRRSPRPQSPAPTQTPRSPPPLETPTRPSLPSPADPKAPFVLVPAPTTSIELCNAMRHLIQSTTPRLQVPRLISTHSQYPTLHTATSFNVLLAYAVRVAPYYFRPILAQMRTSGIAWDARTQKLVVRAHIQAGRWLQAIEFAEQTWLPQGTTGASTMPLDVFIELMHLALSPKFSREDVATMAQRCWRLFPVHASADASPRLTYNVVRLLVNQGRADQAVQLTKRLLESLSYAAPGATRYCRTILGLVIRPPERSTRRSGPCPTPPFRERLDLFESLLTHNPSLGLTPDAKLTRCLLENLFRSRNRGAIAFHKLGELRAEYGPVVEDSAIRRLIARYAMQEGNLGLARAMREREELARNEPVQAFAASVGTSSSSKGAPWVGDEPIPMQSHLEYIRRVGTENVKWTELSRNLRRAEEKRRLAGSETARALDEGKGKRSRAWYTWVQRRRKRVLKRTRKMTNV